MSVWPRDEGDDHEALRAHADARLAALDARDRTYCADEYHQKVREKVGALKDAPGDCEFVFKSPSFSSLERLQLPASVEKAPGEVVYLISPTPASYIHHHVTRKFTSAAAMQRAAQQEDGDDTTGAPRALLPVGHPLPPRSVPPLLREVAEVRRREKRS